jgi:hypothetical protein
MAAALLLLALAGCATITKVETGERVIGDRFVLTLDGPWNHVEAPGLGPAQIWTMEGLPIDQLMVYAGLKSNQVVHAVAPGATAERKSFAYRSSMQPHEVVAMFEGMLTRDGSKFELRKIEPMPFAGEKGFRFEYSLVRRADNVRLSGVGYGAVSKGELYAILYIAPRLTFFDRQKDRVEKMARSARIRI